MMRSKEVKNQSAWTLSSHCKPEKRNRNAFYLRDPLVKEFTLEAFGLAILAIDMMSH